ncbi:MAG: hypothetical protein COX57_00030 [Alphaproteobacteria bacterium CG_4_10_14_0_2_um_filter_63_37]|nr:MAG: hypothetical protein AUJ55_06535 [Proteobacteria bacterium CG1_02_64_396]PJA26083.1 MAG: hypothetical protein COX57_00030 [Alphaproteobacteria bacterium CG_4_10_14_0_2_um_filter_63_37]
MPLNIVFIFILIVLFAAPPLGLAQADEPSCHYTTYRWSTFAKSAVDVHSVRHPYAELQPTEIDPATGCTVCEEDQIEISLPGLAPFRVCKRIKIQVWAALNQVLAAGAEIDSVVGYRVGMTKGAVDDRGNRTQFSNHAFGVALDINERHNGLYDHCPTFGPGCRLLRGGKWDPGQIGSLTPDHPIVRALDNVGLKWGGQIEGLQKDFMHFSPSGY